MKKELFRVTYGSKLYGTSTPSSDTDLKAVYLPTADSLLLGHKPLIYKTRVDKDGVKVPDDSTMPADGVETEFFPFQTFVRDFVQGQTYAVEVAFAFLNQEDADPELKSLITELVDKFTTSEVSSMVGFAMKQTFDYVRRGERLNAARNVMAAVAKVNVEMSVEKARGQTGSEAPVRLDTPIFDTKVLDYIANESGLKIGQTLNNDRVMRTLELNGRSYLETSALEHFATAVKKLIGSYGERTNDASEKSVDYKSLSHAIRVYQQSIELLDTGRLTFPRPNAAYLLSVKEGKEDLEQVKVVLRELDDEVQTKIAASTIQRKTDAVVEAAEQWLLVKLRGMYHLS